MRLRGLVLSVLLLSLLFITSLQIQACLENERKGLLELKSYFIAHGGNDTKEALRSWVIEDSNCCKWERVKCSNSNNITSTTIRHITHLSLGDLLYNNRSGMFNASLLSPFQELHSLDLSYNSFEGWNSNEGLSRLKKLENLELSWNNLNNSILSSLIQLSSLKTLDLSYNFLFSPPTEESFPILMCNDRHPILTTTCKDKPPTLMTNGRDLLNLKSIKILNLRGTGFIGSIQGFSRLKELESLDLSVNDVNISILSSLNQLTSLRTLKLHATSMNGPLPAQDFVGTSQLEMLDLSESSLNGSLLVEDFSNWKNLKVLDLTDNSLNGSIEGLCSLKGLIGLSLSFNYLNGQLPECLGNLTNLKVLDLFCNQFTGNFPSFVTNLTSLEYLSLSENYLQGSFLLSNLANHSKLQYLLFSSNSPGAQVETERTKWFPNFQLKSLTIQNYNINKDQGSMIPSFLLYQHDLKYVDLSHNKMVGEFPNWLIHNNSRMNLLILRNNSFEGNLKLFSKKNNITFLDISNNNLSGLLQEDIGTVLPDIVSLNLSINNFEGNIPTSICKMKKVEFMDLSHNHFSGELPQNLATKWTSLRFFRLSNNFLQGNIPRFLDNTELESLYLNNNNFNGTLKELFSTSPKMSVLDISNNSICGEIPSSIGHYIHMEVLLMAQNQLEGEIPNVFYNMTGLIILDLSENRLFGFIPNFNKSQLMFLYLQKNALYGYVPFSLSESLYLRTLDLRDNQFSGYVPNWINKLSKLRILLLGGNKFEGDIPNQLCQLSKITIIDLSRNTINGSIPSCFQNLTFGQMPRDDDLALDSQIDENQTDENGIKENNYYSVDRYNLTIAPIYVRNLVIDEVLAAVEFRTKSNYYSYRGNILEKMTGLDLSCNNLSGIIPSQIGNLQQLRSLNLSHNYLSGFIPETFSNLTQIESLDLSFNNLSGQIPLELTQLNFLSIFNVSYNNLSGMTPNTRQFATFDDENYKGNPNLCGSLLKHKCEGVDALTPSSSMSNNKHEENEEIVDMVAFYWSFTASYITILLEFIAVLCINPYWHKTWFYFIDKVIHKCFSSFRLY